MTYKPSKDGSTSTLLKHLNNKHSFILEKKEKATGAMDKFVEKLDAYVLYNFMFSFLFYLILIIKSFVLTEIYTRKLA